MKYSLKCIGLLLLFANSSCELDNYEPPSSTLSGTLVYNGDPVGLRSGGVQLELWQSGFALNTKIPVNVSQDGEFSASLFDGTYKLTFLAGNGPWVVSTDTIVVDVKGSTSVTVPVEPYYVVRNASITGGGSQVSSTFNVEQINGSRALQWVGLYVGTTSILDNINNRLRVELPAESITSLDEPINIAVNLTAELSARSYVFARIGVKTSGVNEMLFSPVFKIDL